MTAEREGQKEVMKDLDVTFKNGTQTRLQLVSKQIEANRWILGLGKECSCSD